MDQPWPVRIFGEVLWTWVSRSPSTAMFPFLGTSACPLLPSSGSRLCQFPTFIKTMRGVRLLPFHPGRLRFLGDRYLFREMLLRSPGRRISADSRAWPVRVGGTIPEKREERNKELSQVSVESLKARLGLGTPAAPGDLALTVARILPSARLTASASASI